MKTNISANERLIVALDVNTNKEALELVDKLGDDVTFYKIGWQLFIGGSAYDLIRDLANRGKRVFLDLKMEDIGTTIELTMKNVPREYIDFIELLTLKGSGAKQLVKAAKQGVPEQSKLQFLMLTALSSLDDEDIKEVYGDQATLESIIRHNTKTALDAKCDGLIASGESIRDIRREFPGDYWIVAPGIRPKGFGADDHKRSLTPYVAISYGADYLVVGRPITKSDDPKGVATAVIADIQRALDDKSQSSASSSGGSESDNGPFGLAAAAG